MNWSGFHLSEGFWLSPPSYTSSCPVSDTNLQFSRSPPSWHCCDQGKIRSKTYCVTNPSFVCRSLLTSWLKGRLDENRETFLYSSRPCLPTALSPYLNNPKQIRQPRPILSPSPSFSLSTTNRQSNFLICTWNHASPHGTSLSSFFTWNQPQNWTPSVSLILS